MPVSSRNDTARMRELIRGTQHERKWDQQAQKLLRRLANDAAGVLARLENWCERKGRASCWRGILLECINAERLTRTFPKHIEEANKTLDRCKRLREPLAECRKFLRENESQNWALWDNRATIEHGLDLLEYGIDTQMHVTRESFAQVGATRKLHIESAPINAAMWVLSAAVKRYTGKPHNREVADLASAIFNTTIDEGSVRHAVSNRGRRFKAMEKQRAKRLPETGLREVRFRAHSGEN
jgi:hypothetical protein